MNKKKSVTITIILYAITLLVGFGLYYVFVDLFTVYVATLLANIVMTLMVFLASIRYNNSSLYDPYWSVIPVFIVLLWIVDLGAYSLMSWLVFIGVFLWGTRLTLNWHSNFVGYTHEDFRYVEFRERFKKWYWVVSWFGVHLFPTMIVYVSLYPIYHLLTNTISVEWFVLLGVLIMVSGAYISFIADNQLRAHKSDDSSTSIKHGLWAYSRHPNYFGEVFFWFGVFVAGTGAGFHYYTALGIIGMLLLFNLYSVPKMEQKLLRNKEDYNQIINEVPRFMFFKRKAD